jgi:hypothetical protein
MCDTCTHLAGQAIATVLAAEVIAAEAAGGWSIHAATRPLHQHEVRARVRFGDLERLGDDTAGLIARHASDVHSAAVTALISDLRAIADRGDALALLNQLQALASPVSGTTLALRGAIEAAAERITETLAATRERAAGEVVLEARRQGVPDVQLPLAGDLPLSRRDEATLQALARTVAEAPVARVLDVALREARAGFTNRLHAASILAAVQTAVGAVSTTYVQDLARQAATTAVNDGRQVAATITPEPEEVYASELMDGNTCRPCADVDGRRYASLTDALVDYPSGGTYAGCLGGPRCRGTLVFVWESEQAPTLDQAPGDRRHLIDRTPRGPSIPPADGGQGQLPILA